LGTVPGGANLHLYVFSGKRGNQKNTSYKRVDTWEDWDPDPKKPAYTKKFMDHLDEYEPDGETPLVETVLAAREKLAASNGAKVRVVLTDGGDSTYKGNIREALKEAFRDPDVRLYIVGFQITGKWSTPAEANGYKQVKLAVDKDLPNAKFELAQDREQLAERL